MRRRDVVRLLGATALVAPLNAAAQTPAKVHRVGLLGATAALGETSPFGAALGRGLAPLGYALGRNLAFEARGATGRLDRLPGLYDELAASRVEVVVANGYPATLVAKQKAALPVVAINAGDPVDTGLVASLARPGGNVTGISDVSAELTPKRIEFLKSLIPQLRRVAVLWNADDLGMTLRYRASEAGAKAIGIAIQPLGVREPEEFEAAFAAMERERPDAILLVTDSLTNLNRKRVLDYAATHRLPAIYEFDFFVRDGGLMSYGPDQGESLARVASLVDRILRGAKPADLPFEQPTRFKLAINLKTAAALGLEFPPALFALADEVIE